MSKGLPPPSKRSAHNSPRSTAPRGGVNTNSRLTVGWPQGRSVKWLRNVLLALTSRVVFELTVALKGGELRQLQLEQQVALIGAEWAMHTTKLRWASAPREEESRTKA